MILARVQVISRRAVDAASPLQPQPVVGNSSHRRVCGRLSVLDPSVTEGSFDSVQICLRGVIASRIGVSGNIEDLITLTDVRSPRDFQLTACDPDSDEPQSRHLDFYFDFPAKGSIRDKNPGQSPYFPPSRTISGLTHIQQPSALSDRHIVRGICEVSYWIEAQFRLGGQKVGCITRAVQLEDLSPRLCAALPSESLSWHAKPDLLARCRFQKSPELNVQICQPEFPLVQDADGGPQRVLNIPLAVTLDVPPPAGGGHEIDTRQSLRCSAVARWEISTRFSSVPILSQSDRLRPGEMILSTSTSPRQTASLLFRPIPAYDHTHAHAQTSYVATAEFILKVPAAVSEPSFRWGLLSKSYRLDLSLHFDGFQGAPRYHTHSIIPIMVSPDASKSNEQLKAMLDLEDGDDLLLGSDGASTPPPQYIG